MKAAFRRFIASLLEHQVRRLIARNHLHVVAVGGSVGKTSTKTFIATVLREKYRVLAHESNYNTEIGLPLSIFDMRVPSSLLNPFAWAWRLARAEGLIRHYPYDVIVVELGTDHVGEIPHYLTYLHPTIGVITAVTPEHMEGFPGGMDEVAAEELALAAASHTVVANHDDIRPADRHKYLDPHPDHHYYGLTKAAEYRVQVASTDPVGGTRTTITPAGHAPLDLTLNLYGAHSAKAAAAAYAVGDLLGLSREQITAGLAKIHAVAGRRIALLGSMNELGPSSPQYHEEAGRAAAGVDLLVTVGQLANTHLGPAAVRAGLDPSRCHAAGSPYAAGEYLRLILGPGDVLLAKGSQNGVFAEEALKPLLADPADARHLVRQSPHWLKIKAKQFSDAPMNK
jgi:UDP-N-acetylmuramoyl-tripeptide--D-alanyl-D-alanine ligase